MVKSYATRLVTVLGLCLLSLYLLYPTYVFYFRASPELRENNTAFCRSMPSWTHCAKLNLGLDLQGGVHLVMGVRVDKALEHRADRIAESLEAAINKAGLSGISISRIRGTHDLLLAREDRSRNVGVDALLKKEFSHLLRADVGPGAIRITLAPEDVAQIEDGAVEQSIKTIRNRADKLGVTEPTIARRGRDNILIQLPGVKDPQHAIDIIGKTAQLEFIMVDTRPSGLEEVNPQDLPAQVVRQGRVGRPSASTDAPEEFYFELPEDDRKEVEKVLTPHLKIGRQLAFGPVHEPSGAERLGFLRTWVLQDRPGITGDYLTQAQVQQGQELPHDFHVSMTFSPEGAKIFGKLTAENVHRPMAIVLDGKVISAPVINEKIEGGQAQISLGRGMDPQAKMQEAKDLALVLKAGALPAPVEIREKRQVGRTLGQDTVARGTLAMAVGTALVFVFMALYYKVSGLVANVALVLNLLFMVATLSFLEATLTLPGMAGIVLTIGMAVDANVLIFERIREELRAGRPAHIALDAGYQKAFGTIFDSNITTLIAGVVLMQYGTGPVRGFAVTLIIGLTCSLYTAIVVTRLIFDMMLSRQQIKTLSI